MSSEWIKSPVARRVLAHWADPRPTWLWSADGEHLLWRNSAAYAFGGKLKKGGLKRAPQPTPLRGQIARLIRLGSPNHSSLSRMQFLLGDKPISATCACMPLTLRDGQTGLLVTVVDPIEAAMMVGAFDADDGLVEAFLPKGMDYLLTDKAGQAIGGSSLALEHYAPAMTTGGPLDFADDSAEITVDGQVLSLTRRPAGPDGQSVLLIERSGAAADADIADAAPEDIAEPLLPIGLTPLPENAAPETPEHEHWVEPLSSGEQAGSTLFDQPDEPQPIAPPPETEERTYSIAELIAEVEAAEEDAAIRAFTAEAVEPETPVLDDQPVATEVEKPTLFKVTGRGFTAAAQPADETEEPVPETPVEPVADEAAPPVTPEAENVERVSRYNFDELSRILTDRVAGETPDPEPAPAPAPPRPAESAQINLASETFVLNRLPLAILVFRDQQVLFANRALTELTGYEGIDSLRHAGLAAIFPGEDQAAQIGPVAHLLRKDGTSVSVTARLQSIPWQGRPALMLTASQVETRLGHEIAVKSFAEVFAAAREEGFVSADRSGVITHVSGHARALLNRTEKELVGRPLSVLLEAQEIPALKAFLERPARFAETTRPSLVAQGVDAGTRVLTFAEGQAGIVTGYFSFIYKLNAKASVAPKEEAEPGLLVRVSRGVRRPLNTVIGFSDLIGTSAFGSIDNPRYLEYARDIKSAGQEIAALVDELDDYARLKDGRYAPRPADIDLAALLESCVVRVRGQANAARVLVRSAISERLPRITADRASLGQAVLNLLASAIDQTPVGGSVVLSAQLEEDGGIAVHVRDNGAINADMSERFVVFRDGTGRDGEILAPVRSSVGLALTRSLLAVNACSLSMDPSAGVGTLFTMLIPKDLVTA